MGIVDLGKGQGVVHGWCRLCFLLRGAWMADFREFRGSANLCCESGLRGWRWGSGLTNRCELIMTIRGGSPEIGMKL
jgi:hypothetical protein